MTVTYQPGDPAYFEESDARREMARVFDLCTDCRRCIDLCGVFPSLFERMAELQKGNEVVSVHVNLTADHMTPSQQDAIAEQCFHCGLCVLGCPYEPVHSNDTTGSDSAQSDSAQSDSARFDFPGLMVRAAAIRHRGGHLSPTQRLTSSVLNRTEAVGAVGVKASGIVNRAIGAEPGSLIRRTVAKVTGISAIRLIPPYTRQRFSTWFNSRSSQSPEIAHNGRGGQVTVFPTCTVEYLQPQIGHDLVKVYERNGLTCSVSKAGCCGAPWLHSGDLDRFGSIAAKNVKILADEIRAGSEIVVPQPTCTLMLKREYLQHVGGADAELVAAHTFDASDYLWRMAEQPGSDPGGILDTRFEGHIPDSVTYHAPCHLRVQGLGRSSAHLLALTGTKVTVVEKCSGTDGLWGLRAGNEETAIRMAQNLGEAIEATGTDALTGDCHLANTSVTEQTARTPEHPLQFLARAYGITPEP
jgi:glycerol-3-phosphate dehydrogenase subunit C